jgi:hypothetical protein
MKIFKTILKTILKIPAIIGMIAGFTITGIGAVIILISGLIGWQGGSEAWKVLKEMIKQLKNNKQNG